MSRLKIFVKATDIFSMGWNCAIIKKINTEENNMEIRPATAKDQVQVLRHDCHIPGARVGAVK